MAEPNNQATAGNERAPFSQLLSNFHHQMKEKESTEQHHQHVTPKRNAPPPPPPAHNNPFNTQNSYERETKRPKLLTPSPPTAPKADKQQRVCSVCKVAKSLDCFSKNQKKKSANAKCMNCIGAAPAVKGEATKKDEQQQSG